MAIEKRLIDANVVLAKQFATGLSDASGNYYGYADVVFVNDIENMPIVDAVEVVRCRDCTYWGDEDGKLQSSDGFLFARCKAHNYLIDGRHTGWCPSENDFCSCGEQKDGDKW